MSNAGGSSVNFNNISLSYGRGNTATIVFEGFNLDVHDGESVAIIGPSGCGKTSLLHMACGVMKPSSGEVTVGDTSVLKPRRDVSLILQDAGLLPWKTVWENAALGLKIAREPTTGVNGRLQELDIQDLVHRYPSELSGGQRQRVGIARALAGDPTLMLMDEPLASLDAFTKAHIQKLFLDIWLKRRHTQLLVTHDLEEAVFLGSRIVILSPRPATIRTIIDNPNVEKPDWRNSDEFFNQVLNLRKALA
jgi:NitT/TauT family transport system ATP-binding protein